MVVGTPPPDRAELASEDIREVANRHGRAALTDVHGTSLVAIISGHLSPTDKFLANLLSAFSDGPVVIGPTAPSLSAAHHSASEAISGMNSVAGWSGRRGRLRPGNCCPNAHSTVMLRRSPRCTTTSCGRWPTPGPR